ncbi:HK97 family phage prohead protease [Candidatus Binatus sp.]|uniref:HK97 family phage prohead protease n=1 Tax=Candidatus Binatus sp. TaxID=2811406 RepID=UPI003CB19CA1
MSGRIKLVGYAAIWGAIGQGPKLGAPHPQQKLHERFAPGAFADSIADDHIRVLYKHDDMLSFASNSTGSLSLREDDIGLAFEIEPREIRGRFVDLVIDMVRDGRLWGVSPSIVKMEWREDPADGRLVRTILRAKLVEISLTDHPNFLETSVRLIEPSAAKAAPANSAPPQRIVRDGIDLGIIRYQDVLRQRIRASRVHC